MSSDKKPTVAIVYYSTWGHIRSLAESIAEGLKAGGAEVKYFQCPETLPEAVLDKMYAVKQNTVDHPILTDVNELTKVDGIMWGIPTRFGMAAAQVKSVLDSTGGIWMSGGLVGKPAGIFFSTGSLGGNETTAMTFLTQLAHHGMIYVPLGYRDQGIANNEEVHGGSPWGAGTVAGPKGERKVTDLEKKVAVTQGKSFAEIVKKLSA